MSSVAPYMHGVQQTPVQHTLQSSKQPMSVCFHMPAGAPIVVTIVAIWRGGERW